MLRSDLVSEKNFDLGNLFKFDEASTASPSATFIFVKNKNVSDKNVNSLNFWARTFLLVPKSPAWRPEFRTSLRKELGRRQHYQKLAGVGRQLRATSYLFKKPNKKEELKTKANFFNFWARDFPLVPKAPSWPPDFKSAPRNILGGR